MLCGISCCIFIETKWDTCVSTLQLTNIATSFNPLATVGCGSNFKIVISMMTHQMEPFSALLTLSADNSTVFFDLRLNKGFLCKQSQCWWIETPSCSLWRHCNANACCGSSSRALLVKLLSGECHITPLIINQDLISPSNGLLPSYNEPWLDSMLIKTLYVSI